MELILSFIFFTAINCSETIVINQSKDPWNSKDEYQLNYSKKRCGEIFINSPCLKKFVKRKVQTYWAICGKENE